MRGPGARGTSAATLLALALVLVPGPATAEPTWLPPTTLTDGSSDAGSATVVFDPSGAAVVLWSQVSGVDNIVRESTRAPGGGWSAPVIVSAPSGGDVGGPEAAVGPDGAVSAAWPVTDADGYHIEASTRAAGGGWASPVVISLPFEDYPDLAVDVDPSGTAYALWAGPRGDTTIVQAATRSAGGTWSGPVTISDENENADDVDVAATPSGATAIWSRDSVIQVRSHTAGTGWGPVADLTSFLLDSYRPQIASDPSGALTATWLDGTGTGSLVRARSRPAGGGWQSTVQVSESGTLDDADVAMDGSGLATVVWTTTTDDVGATRASTRAPGGAWTAPVTLSAGGRDADIPHVVAGSRPGEAVAWWRLDGDFIEKQLVQAARLSGGVWSPPVALSATGGYPGDAALDAQGNGVAAWSRYGAGHEVLEVAALDATGPSVAAAAVPATTYVGSTQSFTVTAADSWSPVASSGWSFGDGTSASVPGTTALHAYAKAGDYPVTVTAVDAVGNGTSVPAGTVRVFGKPSLSKVSLTRSRIHVDGKAKQRRSRLVLTLSAPAKVRVVVTALRDRKGKPLKVRLRKELGSGKGGFVLRSRMKGTTLKPGRYRVKVQARNPAGVSQVRVEKLVVVR